MATPRTLAEYATRPAPKLGTIATAAREVSRMCRIKANELDDAFVKHCDPRALQGGAICEEAHEWRELARQAAKLTMEINDAE